MNGRLEPVAAGDLAGCADFIRKREWEAVTLASFLSADGEPVLPGPRAKAFVRLARGEAGETAGLLMVTVTGMLLHSLSGDFDGSAFLGPVRDLLAPLGVRCVIGEAEGSRFFEACLRPLPVRSVDYRLMTLLREPAEELCRIPELGSGGAEAAIVRGMPADAEALLPLQEEYEKEEVIPPGDPFVRKVCLANLAATLERQIVYGVKAGDAFVAKAGTNARGMGWDQIGGVYTVPEYRNRGLAGALVAYTARERMRAGRQVALFVKPGNLAACGAYERVGFAGAGGFRISYY